MAHLEDKRGLILPVDGYRYIDDDDDDDESGEEDASVIGMEGVERISVIRSVQMPPVIELF